MPKRKEPDYDAEAQEFYDWQDSLPDHVVVGAVSPSFMRRAKQLGCGLHFTFVPDVPHPKDPEGTDGSEIPLR